MTQSSEGPNVQKSSNRNQGQNASHGANRGRRGNPRRRPNRRGQSGKRRHTNRGAQRRPRPPAPLTPADLAARAAALPVVTYPDLPVSDHRDEIAEAVRENQVVIVAGETGSGKTTQLPKICLEVGRGIAGMIGHTQPRRLAARAVAERIASELGQTVGKRVGDVVGYQVRFTDEVGPTTLIKLMTDGILLAEMGSDPNLSRYDTIIVDEAHERSLNIDFILGYLGRLLKKRKDLKVIITSATIDSERFREHFEEQIGAPVPVIEVSGRTYPVEVRYRPLIGDVEQSGAPDAVGGTPSATSTTATSIGTELHPEPEPGELATLGYGLGENIDLETALVGAVDELLEEEHGDILVFLPGERDILDAREALAHHLKDRFVSDPKAPGKPNGIEVLPLFARLSAPEQHRIYAPHHRRRIILSTNIAETSLTVPGIKYVVDAGLARISRFSNKTKVQRLPIEGVSKASAGQRAGRAGRTSAGVAVRLYSERDFANRDDFTEPEILRTSLASVILQMKALGLGDVKDFPFLDAPAPRAVRDGVQLLEEIGALDKRENITSLGRTLARLPIDPRLGRMLIEADRKGCASEVLVIVAALSIQDPRERPVEHQDAADEAHARYVDKRSDFITYLNMWRYLNTKSRDMSGSAFRRMCRREFFHYLRFREWRDIVRQLSQMTREVGIKTHPISLPSNRDIDRHKTASRGKDPYVAAAVEAGLDTKAVDTDHIHMSILTGLLSNIGNWDEPKRNYVGARGTRFMIWPGSGLKNRRPEWVMAAELVETSRLFARTVAGIKPEWVEHYARNLVKRSYSEPTWSRAHGAAQVSEKVTLYGLTLIADRKVPLTRLGDTDLGVDYATSKGVSNPALALAISGTAAQETRLTARTLAREMFISNALVENDWRENHHRFVKHNQGVMARAEEMSDRMRDPSLVPDEAARYQFFNSRLPGHVTSAAQFNKWWRNVREKSPHLLDYTLSDLVPETETLDETHFPSAWKQGDLALPLAYSFDPGDMRDGITVTVPLDLLPRVEETGFDWLVPGLLEELVVATLRGLPKAKRRLIAPATQTGEEMLQRIRPPQEGEVGGIQSRENDSRKADSRETAPEEIGPQGSDEVDPYSLDASLARLMAWGGSSGTVQTTKTPKKQKQAGQRPDQKPDTQKHRTQNLSKAQGRKREDEGKASSSSPKKRPSKPMKPMRPQTFTQSFTDVLRELKGVEVTAEDLAHARASLPPHLNIGFQVTDQRGAILGYGHSLPELQKRFAARATQSLQTTVERALREAQEERGPLLEEPAEPEEEVLDQALFATLTEANIKGLPDNALPKVLEATNEQGLLVRGYPSLTTEQRGLPNRMTSSRTRVKQPVSVGVAQTLDEANRDWTQGLAQLLLNDLALDTKRVTTRWSGREALMLAGSPYPSTEALVADAQAAAMVQVVDQLTGGRPWSVRDAAGYENLRARARDRFEDQVYDVLGGVVQAVEAAAELETALQESRRTETKKARDQARDHGKDLFFDGYLTALPQTVLPEVPRYLRALAYRVNRAELGTSEARQDQRLSTQLKGVMDIHSQVGERVAARPYSASVALEMDEIAMLIEELKVSLFAQSLGTKRKVSPKRVVAKLQNVERRQ